MDNDGVADIIDADGNGTFDSVINTSCNAPDPLETQLLINPEVPGNYNNGTLAPNMVFDQGTGETIFTPNCGQIGLTYDISYSQPTIATT